MSPTRPSAVPSWGLRLLVLVAALALAALTARLGVWQLDRADQKLRLHAALQSQRALPPLAPWDWPLTATQARAAEHRGVELAGQWVAEHTVLLDNRQMQGRPGFFVLTPLRLDDGSVVLVQRGWVVRDPVDRSRVVLPPPPPQRVAVAGRIATGAARLYDFDPAAGGLIRQNLDLSDYARETGLPLRPWVLIQEDAGDPAADGLMRLWPVPTADVHKHHGYAFQWFSLSALTLGLYVWFQVLQPRRRRP